MTAKKQAIGAPLIQANISPFAFQHYARDFFAAYLAYRPSGRFSPARLFLISRSIELASKALQIAQHRKFDEIKKINHNLVKSCDTHTLARYAIVLTTEELEALRMADAYYSNKGFEYFWFTKEGVPPDRSGPTQALLGWPDLPKENELECVYTKLTSVDLSDDDRPI
jgi:hypothetical protein